MNQSENNSETHQVPVNSAKAWRNEAETMERSESHLNKIDQVLTESPTEKVDNQEVVNLSERDFKAMQKDREEFKQHSQSQGQDQSKSQTLEENEENISQKL